MLQSPNLHVEVKNKSLQASSINALILDMDGVLWRGSEPVGNLAEIFDAISSLNMSVTLATNNASRAPEQYLEKLLDFGVRLELNQVVNSAQAASRYLKKKFPSGGPVYVIGEEGLHRGLKENGFYHSTENPLAVVSGLDRSFTFETLSIATALIRSGALFIATNTDPTFPTPNGLTPGAGAIIAAIQTASGVKPVVAGKPSPELYLFALERMGSSPAETLVVGDRLTTDIAGAQEIGCPNALVLSGVTSLEEAENWSPPPDLIAPDLTSVLAFLADHRPLSGKDRPA